MKSREVRFVAVFAAISFMMAIAPVSEAEEVPWCNGTDCSRNPGSGDGFVYDLSDNCPTSCGVKKYHAGSSCQLTGGESRCSPATVPSPYWYTSTSTCIEMQCDFSNSYWSQSSTTVPTPTCMNAACLPVNTA